jgi:hypothetical protein
MVQGASVAHHIPGRLRVRVPRARRDPQLLNQLAEFVEKIGGVRQVEINPMTGSILVHYHPGSRGEIDKLLQPAQASEPAPVLPSEAEELADKIEKEAQFLAAHSELAMQVVQAIKSLNREVRQATGNTVDLKVLLPAGLAVWAFFKANAEVATPLWVTLAIFAFNSFVALHYPTAMHLEKPATRISAE